MADPQHADMLAAWNEPRHGANQCEHGHLARVCVTCEQAAEITRLTVERDWLMKKAQQSGREIDRLTKEALELRAQVAALEMDARRYRWLRDNANVMTPHIATPDGWKHYRSGADEVVDAALAARKGEA